MTASRNNQTLNQIMSAHPIVRVENRLKESVILSAFSKWLGGQVFQEWHLPLYRLAADNPLCHINPTIIDEALNLFRQHPSHVISAIADHGSDISHAVLSLLRPGSSWGKDEPLSLDTPNDLVECESIWHPEYLRYCEQIYNHLIQIPLAILGQVNGKKYVEQTLANRVDTLQSLGLNSFTAGYNSTVRNALSHGHVSFGLWGVTYTDRTKQEEFAAYEFGDLFDNLVDTCHSLVVALLLFLCESRTLVEQQGLDKLPLGIRFLFIDGLTYHRSMRLVSMIESRIAGNKKQLNLVCQVRSKARSVHLFEATFMCWAASKFGGKDYNRYVVSLDCGMPSFATIAFDGEQMYRAIENDESLSQCAPRIVESSLLWYDASRIESRAYAFKSILATQWVIAKRQIIADFERAGMKLLGRHYSILDVQNTSPRSFRRIEAHLVLHYQGTITSAFLLQILDHAIRKLRTKRVRLKDLYGEKGFPARPHSITVKLYSQERRLRKLKTLTWISDELILIAEWSRNWKVAPPFYTRDAQLVHRGIRVKLNERLLTSNARVP